MKAKPGLLQSIIIMTLIDGILNILWAFTLMSGLVVSIIGIICLPLALYPLILGIVEIVYGIGGLQGNKWDKEPPRFLAWMQIGNIVVGDPISVIVGVLALVFYGDERVREYYYGSTTLDS